MNERIRKLIRTKSAILFPGTDVADCQIDDIEKFAELIIHKCASIVYQTCQDGDIGAQAILYEFDIDNARSQK